MQAHWPTCPRNSHRKPKTMRASHVPKVAGINPLLPGVAHNCLPDRPEQPDRNPVSVASGGFADLTTLHELTEQLAGTVTLDAALEEFLRAGASLVGARRGLAVLEPSDGLGPQACIGYGLLRADLGII